MKCTSLPLHIGGKVHDARFDRVLTVFRLDGDKRACTHLSYGRENFVDGWEHEGAALAVYHRGRLVVDVWGGYADENTVSTDSDAM